MAKKSAVEKNNKRKRIVAARGARRAALRAIVANKNVSMEEEFLAFRSDPDRGIRGNRALRQGLQGVIASLAAHGRFKATESKIFLAGVISGGCNCPFSDSC